MEHRFVTMKPMRPGVSGFARIEPEAGGAAVQLHARGLRVKAVRAFWYREGGETRELGGARVNVNGEASLTARLSAVAAAQGTKALLVVSDESAPRPLLCGLCSPQSAGNLLDAKNALLALCERVRREHAKTEADLRREAGEAQGGNLPDVAPPPADIAVSPAVASPSPSPVAPPPDDDSRPALSSAAPTAPLSADIAVSPAAQPPDGASRPALSSAAPTVPLSADIAVSPAAQPPDGASRPALSSAAPTAPPLADITASPAVALPASSPAKPLAPRASRSFGPRQAEPPRESFLPAIDPSPYVIAGEAAPRSQTKSPSGSIAEKASNDEIVFRPSAAAPPADRLPALCWPQAFAPLRRHFDRLPPVAVLDLPGWRFVALKPGLYVGRLARDGRVVRVAYALRLDAPPSDGRPYQTLRGLDGQPYQVLWQRAESL